MWEHYRKLLSPDDLNEQGESIAECVSEYDLFTWQDISMGITKLKNNKALGNCHIDSGVLKSFNSESFCKGLANLFNKVLRVGMPKSWNRL